MIKTVQLKIAIVLFIAIVTLNNQLYAQQLTTPTAVNLIKANASVIGLSETDISNMRISAAYIDKVSGASLVYAQQTYKGADVFNAIQIYAFKKGKLISASGEPLANIADMINKKDGKASVSPANAVRAAAAHLMLPVTESLTESKQTAGVTEFDFGKLNFSSVAVKSKLIWLPDELTKKAWLTWQVEIQPKGKPDYWLVNVDAIKGNVISKINLNIVCDWTHPNNSSKTGTYFNTTNNTAENDNEKSLLVNSAKYTVVPFPFESPNHTGGAPVTKPNPWELAGTGNNATTLQWNSNGTKDFDSTRGNNVLAVEDVNGDDTLGNGAVSKTPLPNLSFTFSPDFGAPPTISKNQNFAITNLFYWNNIMHDISYQYGFDEVSGNFQANNLGRGGAGNDYVFADAQDGSSSNNANFRTPKDGTNPRMQMFLFDAVPNFKVNSPASFAGSKTATESQLSTNNKIADKGPITKGLILYKDNASGTSHEGCTAAVNSGALAGRIALIDRGTCAFTVKIKNAQNAGAIGVIVADNIPGEYPFIMGGTDNTITSPAFMVSFETGDTLKQLLSAGKTVNVTMKQGVQLDGDADAGVMSHEYTHGISNRLTGGPNNVTCLQNKEQMGEGWSDYMALMVTTNWNKATVKDGVKAHPIGTYVIGQGPDGPGIRVYPYSTDFNINPWTYDSLAQSKFFTNNILLLDPHVVGEVWANMLWVMTWNIIQNNGIGKNIYNSSAVKGNTIALKLVIEGMKLQKCSPGFVDGRNGILKADTVLFGGQYSPLIWQSFASRGLGYHASEGSSNDVKDGVADYSLPPALLKKDVQVENAIAQNTNNINIAPNPASSKVTLTIGGNKKLLTVDLLNSTGQQINRYAMHGETLQINLPKLASGMYYIRISGDGFAETKKLIIQ